MKFLCVLLAAAAVAGSLAADTLADYHPLPAERQGKLIFADDFEKGAGKEWYLPADYVARRGEGETGGGGVSMARPEKVPYDYAVKILTGFTVNRRWRVSAMARVRNLKFKGQPVKSGKVNVVCVDFYNDKGVYINQAAPKAGLEIREGDADWQHYSYEIPVPDTAVRGKFCLFLKPDYTCDMISWDNVKVEESGEMAPVIFPRLPKQLKLDETGAVTMRVVNFTPARDKTLKLFAVTADGREFEAEVRDKEAHFVLGSFPEGEHRVKFTLVDTATKEILTAKEFPFFAVKCEAPAGAATVDASGRMIVDGKPFFPFGFFIEWPDNFNPENVKELRDLGVNTIIPYHSIYLRIPTKKAPYGINAVRRSLDLLHENGIKVIFSLLEISGTGSRLKSPAYDRITGVEAIGRHVIEKIKDHPALLGWYISDENTPETIGTPEKLRYELARRDPWHPVATLSNVPSYYPWFGSTGDFLMMDCYPVREKKQLPTMAKMRQCFETEARDLAMGPWLVPQSFCWGYYLWMRQPYTDYRYPTEEEMRSHVLLALNHRVRSVIFYAYDPLRLQEKHDPGSFKWFSPRVFNVIRLLKELEGFFLADDAPRALEVKQEINPGSPVEAKLHTANGRTIAVVTADGPGEVRAKITVGRPGMKSRFGHTKEIGDGLYEFSGKDTISDILE